MNSDNDIISAPVFILGLPRTASKWIMHSINQYTDCCIIHELHIKRLWRKGNHRRLMNLRSISNPEEKASYLKGLISKEELIGCYWKLRETEFVYHALENWEIDDALQGVEDGWTLMEAMMDVQMRHYGKRRIGARHPVHFVFIGQILRRYPDAKVLFLTRSVKEIAESWRTIIINKDISWAKKVAMTVLITGQVYMNSFFVLPVMLAFRRDNRVLQVSYEKLITKPKIVFKDICDHIGYDFDLRMADSSIKYGSAYNNR